MPVSIIDSKLKQKQREQLGELVTVFAWRMERQETCPLDDAVLERIEAQKALLTIRSFLNRYGILATMHQDRLRLILMDWYEETFPKETIQERFEQLETRRHREEAPSIVPWNGEPPTIPWRETAKGYGFEMAITPEPKKS